MADNINTQGPVPQREIKTGWFYKLMKYVYEKLI